MPYGCIGSIKTQPGKRDDVVAILLSSIDELPEAECIQYTVGISRSDDVTV
jgi:hypothetical protein